jgi:hypothetical protein
MTLNFVEYDSMKVTFRLLYHSEYCDERTIFIYTTIICRSTIYLVNHDLNSIFLLILISPMYLKTITNHITEFLLRMNIVQIFVMPDTSLDSVIWTQMNFRRIYIIWQVKSSRDRLFVFLHFAYVLLEILSNRSPMQCRNTHFNREIRWLNSQMS